MAITPNEKVEALVLKRLINHLQKRTDVQNIDMMNLAGFCRNCLSNWYKEEAERLGEEVSKDDAKELVYGMPYAQWKEQYQAEATPEQLAKLNETHNH